jgi:hypothetical protein
MAKARRKVNEAFWAWWHAQMDRDVERTVVLAERAWDEGRVQMAREIHQRQKKLNSRK